MTRKEAIERLKQNKAAAEFYAGMAQNTNAIENELKDIEAINMAIEALKAPTENTNTPTDTSTDLISRADAIEAIASRDETDGTVKVFTGREVNEILSALPSATCEDCIWHVCNYNKVDWDGEDGYISKRDAIDALGEEPPVWYDGEDEIAERNQWRRDISAIKSLPSAEPKTMDKTNANKIYNYLNERIGDIVDDMKEFDAWFERMVWHVKECDRLTAEPKTGEWIYNTNNESVSEIWNCSECDQWSFAKTNFCPNCGTKMYKDGEEE